MSEEPGATYEAGDYLGGFICPKCKDVDCLYYEECPACEEKFILCEHCIYRATMDDCKAIQAQP